MKRALLIAGGTIGGLGAVLSITPPHFGSSTGIAGGIKTSGSTSPTTPTATTPTAAPTQSAAPTPATPAKTKKAKPAATKKATAPATAPAASGASGTFTGATSNTQFGPVQVQITVSNGKITAAKALQFPNRDFRSQSISSQAIPYLVQETLAASSSNIQGVGGASYTSQGWYDSLVSALAKAGMK
jgi:uncharacterized protein with FMN-binding domain